eukprot:GHVU01053759.1.p2 GENE.GHVU01053759.1~~GHVU01053759.1.p2  ORF type:complete len:150 (-),score=9.54 GHVU01053759.1:1209-1658(-)
MLGGGGDSPCSGRLKDGGVLIHPDSTPDGLTAVYTLGTTIAVHDLVATTNASTSLPHYLQNNIGGSISCLAMSNDGAWVAAGGPVPDSQRVSRRAVTMTGSPSCSRAPECCPFPDGPVESLSLLGPCTINTDSHCAYFTLLDPRARSPR